MRHSFLALALAIACGCTPAAKERALVHKVERTLQAEVSRLEGFVQQALSQGEDQWMTIEGLPPEMVLYRYHDGELQSWAHSFPVTNDDLGASVEVERLVHPKVRMRSPLSDAGAKPSLMNLGSKWYLVRTYGSDRMKVIAGLELNRNGISCLPLSSTEGVPVRLHGEPVFKIVRADNDDSFYRYVGMRPSYATEENRAHGWADKLSSQTSIPMDSRLRRSNQGMHPKYSYAKYENGACQFFRGPCSYPTRLMPGSPFLKDGTVQTDGYIHFVYSYPEDVRVVISRPEVGFYNFAIRILLVLVLIVFVIFTVKRGPNLKKKNYFHRRISNLVMVSLLVTLAALAGLSVAFVTGRYRKSLRVQMQDRLSMEQSLLQKSARNAASAQDLLKPEVNYQMSSLSAASQAPISLYGTDGHLLMTTAPELVERGLTQARLNEKAFEELVLGGKGSLMLRQGSKDRTHYLMFAPLFGSSGQVVALVCTPYFLGTYDFEQDAVVHSISILSMFLILLMVSYLLTSAIVRRIFRPVAEISMNMSKASLEPIEYSGQDEITPLVDAYNKMADKLKESSAQLAQAERDKAWSGMARQVAHEIKNPLTPIKLQLQRIVRLKRGGNPKWEELFDEVSDVVLEQIDILNDTANEFSTFAKLYSEEPVVFDLDATLRDQISMFDSRSGVHFDYFGLPGTEISGPKPQLIRVFVNLLGNAVQACPAEGGEVRVSLRNGQSDDHYEIVFEDNGPGVSEENVGKLFTPNFTTKNGGSGLGLAISRSILDRCSASISYSKSFSLGGACFKVLYPKK